MMNVGSSVSLARCTIIVAVAGVGVGVGVWCAVRHPWFVSWWRLGTRQMQMHAHAHTHTLTCSSPVHAM